MSCNGCGRRFAPIDLYCTNCGNPRHVEPQNRKRSEVLKEFFGFGGNSQVEDDADNKSSSTQDTMQSRQENPTETETQVDSGGLLVLRVPVIARWLLATEYGTLEVVDDHLIYRLRPAWSMAIWKILAQIICLGFDPLTFLRINGQMQLKNIAVATIVNPKWLKWNMSFFFIASGLFPLVLWVTYYDFPITQAFFVTLRRCVVTAKYVTST